MCAHFVAPQLVANGLVLKHNLTNPGHLHLFAKAPTPQSCLDYHTNNHARILLAVSAAVGSQTIDQHSAISRQLRIRIARLY